MRIENLMVYITFLKPGDDFRHRNFENLSITDQFAVI